MMARALRLFVALLLFAMTQACGSDGGDNADRPRQTASAAPDAGGPIREFEVQIAELGDSGVSGTARLESVGSEASSIVIELEGAPEGPLAVHTHAGPCLEKPSAPTHTLEPVVDGRSESGIGASVQGLTHGHFGILIHENENPNSSHIACGQIGGPPADE